MKNDRWTPKEWNPNWKVNGYKSNKPCCDKPQFPSGMIFTFCDNCNNFVNFNMS